MVIGLAHDEDTTRRILGAARREFFAHGFARTTMDDLARHLGMSKKTLYRHFRSKDELVAVLLETKAAEIRAGFEAIFGEAQKGFFDRIAALFRHLHEQLGEVSATFLRDLKRLRPDLFARLEQVRTEIIPAVWGRLLREGIESGDIRAEIDPDETAYLILLFIQAAIQPEPLGRLRRAPHEVAERIFELLFRGMLTPAGCRAYENNRPAF